MNKYQEFAVMYFLSDFDQELQYDDILAALAGEDREYVTVGEAHQHLSMEEVADDIYQLACDLERWFA